jgi:hypothetical protein
MTAEPKRGRGRPPKAPGEAASVKFDLRLTPAQRDEIVRRGGAEAVRAWLDEREAGKPLRATNEPSVDR